MSYSIRLDLYQAGPDPTLTTGPFADRMDAVEFGVWLAGAIAAKHLSPRITYSLLANGHEVPWPPCGQQIGWVMNQKADTLIKDVTCTLGYGHSGDDHEGTVPVLEPGQTFYVQARKDMKAQVTWDE